MATPGGEYVTQGGQHASGKHGLLGYFLRTPGPSGFSSGSTAQEVAEKLAWDGRGKVCLVTGASTGLGLEAARVLALRGAEVVCGVRDVEKARRNADRIRAAHPGAKLTLLPLDLASLASVREFARRFLDLGLPLHVLMLNAGIMAVPFSLTEDGFESQFATNHLGHFLLTKLLLPAMLDTAANERGAPGAAEAEGRIVVLSSSMHFRSYPEGLRIIGLDSPIGYSAWPAYGQSKLCNVLFVRALAERLRGKPIRVAAVHPGVIQTELARTVTKDAPKALLAVAGAVLNRTVLKSVRQGAATQVYAATSPDIVSGEFYSDCNCNPSHPLAHSRVLGERLWEISEAMVAGTYRSSK